MNMVDPNSVVSSPESRSNQSSEDDLEVRNILKLYQQGRSYRSRFDSNWQTRKEYYNGNQWKKTEPKSRPIMNIVRQTIQATIPILTDQRPGFAVMAKEPTDFDFAKIMGDLIEAWWDKPEVSMDHVLVEVIFDSMLYDAGILKITWDTEAEDGIGDVTVERVDPNDIYVPEGAVDFQKNCPWVIQRSMKSIGWLKNKFPDAAANIRSDQKRGTESSDSKSITDDSIQVVSPVDQYSPNGTGGSNGSDSRKMVEVLECWMDDEAVVTEMVENENGEQEQITKKRFPNGRIVTILPQQNLLLQSVEAPYSHKMKPYVRIVDMVRPGEFWGEGEADSLMHTQRLINKALKALFDYMQLMSNPCWIVKKGSGVKPTDITNSVSMVLMVNDDVPDPVRRDIPPALQSGVLEVLQALMRQAESTSGIAEVSQGRKPVGVTAASAIETLQEAGQTRVRLKERNLQVSLQQLGVQIIALMLQFYRETRVARITNKQGSWPEYREFYIEENEPTPENPNPPKYTMMSKRHWYNNAMGGYMSDENYSPANSKGLMDVKVVAGTALPWAKTTRANVAFKLFDAQAIDDKELLDALEWPNAEQVLQRVQQQKEAMAQKPPPGAPPA